MGWSAADVSDAYYLALLYHMGCTGAVAAQSRLGGGDDLNVRKWMSEADYADFEVWKTEPLEIKVEPERAAQKPEVVHPRNLNRPKTGKMRR